MGKSYLIRFAIIRNNKRIYGKYIVYDYKETSLKSWLKYINEKYPGYSPIGYCVVDDEETGEVIEPYINADKGE